MPGMNRGGAAMPGMGGGGMGQPGGGGQAPGGFGVGMGSALGPRGDLARGAQGIQGAQEALMRAQQQCAQGDGQACMLAQRLQQQLQQAQAQQQGQVGIAQMGMDRGTMGTNGRGRDGSSPQDIASRTLGAMYGSGGGGGLGSNRMGGW